MPTVICKRCNQRIIFSPNTDDIEHQCSTGNPTLDNEDIVVIGSWSDFSGEGRRLNAMLQGSENTLWGTRAAIEGANEELKTRRGLRASTRRQRPHIQFIDVRGDNR